MLGWVETSRDAHSKRLFVARLEGQSAWAWVYPIEIYDKKTRNQIHARTGETEETTVRVVRSPLLVYIDLLALLYVLHAQTLCCVVKVFTL